MADHEADQFAEPTAGMTVRDLRRRWKPIKEGPAAVEQHPPICIRLHRCWSWLQRVEELSEAGIAADDASLIYGWIALNSLYGRWDEQNREPMSDQRTLDAFTSRVLEADRDGRIGGLLEDQRDLVRSIVGDGYLSKYFWRDPSEDELRRAKGQARKLGSLYFEKRYAMILDEVLNRVYLARCQLVHGAATYNGGLNREAVGKTADFLGRFLRAASLVIIEHAWQEDWGGLCYPPSVSG